MDPPTENAGDFDYLLGPATSDAGVPVPDPSRGDAAGDELGSYLDGQALASSDPLPLAQAQSLGQASGPTQPQSQTGGPPQSAAGGVSSAADASAAANAQSQSAAGAAAQASRKRPLDDKKARDKKRILRNRELARVSNERRKGRIKAMETELEDTRKTVLNLEESIRSLEAENSDLKSLLESKSVSRL